MPRSLLSLAAICAASSLSLAVAMGIGRFAFTPMLPLMIRDGSLGMEASPWLAAANYLGYLIGALSASRLPVPLARTAAVSLVGVVLTTGAMGLTSKVPIWLMLRGAAGIFSGWALVGVSAWSLFQLAKIGRPRFAAVVYAGVGMGIAAAGLFCWAAAESKVSSPALWLELGGLALAVAALPLALLRGGPGPSYRASTRLSASGEAATPGEMRLLTLCYGIFGFGYILPATYLPYLGRQMIADPRMFGLVWPVFGMAAAISSLLAGAHWVQANRLRAWAVCQFAMASGALLPSLILTPSTLAASALLVGGTFMVVTMLGMQEARARSPQNAAAALGRMTAAFALGQLAGPLVLLIGPAAALNPALHAAAAALALSAALLWRLSLRVRKGQA